MVSPMRELPSVLQEDLRALSAEARKKFPAIKDAAERGIMKLRSLGEQTPDKYLPAISRSEDVLRPFLLSCETKNPKLHALAVSSLQKLFYHRVVSLSSMPSVLSKLSALVDGEDTVQLKILQALVTLITTTADLHDDNLSQALVVLFRLHASKNPNVHNTSSATLRQVITMLFDRTIVEYQADFSAESPQIPQQVEVPSSITPEERADQSTEINILAENEPASPSSPNTGSPLQSPHISSSPTNSRPQSPFPDEERMVVVGNKVPPSLKPHARDAYLLLQDLCLLTGGDPPAWLPVSHLSRAFGLELIELVLTTHSRLFLSLPEFSFLLKDRVCPLVIKCFRFRIEFQHTLRLVRIVGAFVSKFCHLLVTECEVLLSRLLKMLDPEHPFWVQTIALEVFKTFCENEKLLKSFYVYYDVDNSAKIFEQLVDTIGRYTKSMFTWDSLQVASHSTKNKCIDALSQMEAPVIKESYVVSTAAECLIGIVNAIYQLAAECTLAPHERENKEKGKEREVCMRMAEVSWCPILAALSALLNKSVDEALVHTLLKTHQAFTHTCGLLRMITPRDAFLIALCKCSLPSPYNSHLFSSQEKNSSGGLALSHSSSGTNITGISTSGGVAPADEGIPTLKNVQATKTLMNIAHCMGAVLDTSGWALILETLDHWDRIIKINSYPQPLEEVSIATGMMARVPQAELTNLNTSLHSLFKSSGYLDESSFIAFVSALVKVSNIALSALGPNASAANSTFGLSKIMETSVTNASRISIIWDIVAVYMLEVTNHKNTAVRNFATEALTSLVQTVLPQRISISGGVDKQDVPMDSELNVHMELKITSTLANLSKTSYNDVREKLLSAVAGVLQSSGHALTVGWPLLLSILTSVAENNDKLFVPAAFKSLQLVCTDFLSSLSPAHLALFIDAVGAFCKQTTDINISLTAVGLLWNIADYLAVEQSNPNSIYKADCDQPGCKHSETTDQNNEKPGMFYAYANILLLLDRLWLCVFGVLVPTGIDNRPEVRNCAHISLFKTLTTHGNLLRAPTWSVVLWDLLFPLLDDVKKLTALAANDKIDSDLGGGVMMLVHHSRNTAQKQWDETKVLAMGGMVRVFKIFFDILRNTPEVRFESAWRRLVDYLEDGCLSTSKEVSLAALHDLQDVVQTHVALPSCPIAIRDYVWGALERIAVAMTWGSNATEYAKSLADFVTLLAELYSKTSTFILHSNIRRLIRITHPLALTPPTHVTEPSPLQSSVLDLLRKLPPIPDDIFPLLITQLLKFIAYAINYTYNPTHQDPTSLPPPPNANSASPADSTQPSKFGLHGHYPLAENSLSVVNELFRADNLDSIVRASVYGDIAKVIGAAMMTKYTHYQGPLWKSAVTSFISLMSIGLPAISSLPEIQSHMVWAELMDCIQSFLLHEQGNSAKLNTHPMGIPPEKRAEEEDFDVSLVNAMTTQMVAVWCTTPTSSPAAARHVKLIQERMVEILIEGATMVAASREKFALACYRNLFALAGGVAHVTPNEAGNLKQTTQRELAHIVTPQLLVRCRTVLSAFVTDDRHSGNCPLPRHRLLEVSFLLRELYTLELPPDHDEEGDNKPHKRRHLLELYSILCECIMSSERELKDLLKEIFVVVGKEFLKT